MSTLTSSFLTHRPNHTHACFDSGVTLEKKSRMLSCQIRADLSVQSDEKPTISVIFKSHKAGEPNRRVVVGSGEKQLRKLMIEEKVPLYDAYGSVMNCGGGGTCGTCLVDILEGQALLSERTDAEDKYLKKRPESWRLACQSILGDKSNSGEITVQCLPQKLK